MKTVVQIVLGIVVCVLGYMLYMSLKHPIDFNDEVEHRKALVVERLKDIRTLQSFYKAEHGKFTGSFDTLIDFYKNGNISVVRQIGSMDDSLAVAQKKVSRDTIRIPVKDSLFKAIAGFNIDSIKRVPLVGKDFEMKALIFSTLSGVDVPLFEASVLNNVYLEGLDRQLIINLNDDNKNMNRFQGVKVGSIDSPNNNAGNWE